MYRPGIEPGPPRWEAKHSRKESFEQLVNSYSEHQQRSAEPVENAHDSIFFKPKNCHKALINMVWGSRILDSESEIWNPGSEIRDPEKPYLSRIRGSKRHRVPDPQHCIYLIIPL